MQLYKLSSRQVAAQHGHDRVASCPSRCRRQRQRHAHQHVDRRRRARTPSTTRRARTACRRSAGTSSNRILASATDICLILNSRRQLLPPARPALRGAEPDQGLGDRPRLDGRASRSATSAPARIEVRSIAPDVNPYLRDLHAASRPGSRARSADADDTDEAPHALPAGQHHDAIRLFKARASSRRACWAPRCTRSSPSSSVSAERCPRRSGTRDQGRRDPVPPRGHQPVPLEPVLTCRECGGRAREPAPPDWRGCSSRCLEISARPAEARGVWAKTTGQSASSWSAWAPTAAARHCERRDRASHLSRSHRRARSVAPRAWSREGPADASTSRSSGSVSSPGVPGARLRPARGARRSTIESADVATGINLGAPTPRHEVLWRGRRLPRPATERAGAPPSGVPDH